MATLTQPRELGHRTCAGPSAGRRLYRKLSKVGQWHARTHAVRPVPGRFVRPDLADVAIPAGCQPVLDPAIAATLPHDLPVLTATLREDSRATRLAVWAALVEHLHPDTGLVIASHARLGDRASVHRGRPVPRSTVGNHVRALVAAGVLLVAQHGASATALGADRNRAPVYIVLSPLPNTDPDGDVVLTAEQLAEVARLAVQLDAMAGARVDELGHLPEGSAHTRTEVTTQPRTAANLVSSAGELGGVTADRRPVPFRREHPERFAARTAAERAMAAWWLAAVMGWTGRSRFAALIDKELDTITGPFFAAGWSPRAVVRAWRIQPDGTPWPGPLPTPDQRDSRDQPRIRNLWAVLTHRLAVWRDPLGHPADPPIPTEQPPRGRPPKPPTLPVAPPRPGRGPEAEAAIAAFRAHDTHRRATRAATSAAREARRGIHWRAPRHEADQPLPAHVPAVYLRAHRDGLSLQCGCLPPFLR